jgi:hypothetical protein
MTFFEFENWLFELDQRARIIWGKASFLDLAVQGPRPLLQISLIVVQPEKILSKSFRIRGSRWTGLSQPTVGSTCLITLPFL